MLRHGHDARKRCTHGEDQAAVPATVPKCLQCNRTGHGIQARSAILLRSRQALQTDLRALAPQLARESLIAVAFLKPVIQGALRELDHTLAQDPLLLAQRKIHQPISFNR
jgi:hypothetical protein